MAGPKDRALNVRYPGLFKDQASLAVDTYEALIATHPNDAKAYMEAPKQVMQLHPRPERGNPRA